MDVRKATWKKIEKNMYFLANLFEFAVLYSDEFYTVH
jgi:hypothetical protein